MAGLFDFMGLNDMGGGQLPPVDPIEQLRQQLLMSQPAIGGVQEQLAGQPPAPSPLPQGPLVPRPVTPEIVTRPPPLQRGVPETANLPVDPSGAPPSSPTVPPVPTRLAQSTPPGAVGAGLLGNPPSVPDDGTATNTKGPETVATAAAPTTDFSSQNKIATLAQALRGVTAPKPPELQRISSPNVPRPTSVIKGGDLQALLLALNAGGARAKPTTLGK